MQNVEHKIFLLGGDLSTSKSAVMQNAIYEHFRLPFKYELCGFSSEDKLLEFVKSHIGRDFFAANVTFPYKAKIMSMLPAGAHVDKCAKFAGGTNLILNNKNRTDVCNFDGLGLIAYLCEAGYELKDKRVLIFGTGITACSAAYAFASEGVSEIVFVSRSDDRAYKFTEDVKSRFEIVAAKYMVITYSDLPQYVSSTDILLNATPMGKFADIYGLNPMCFCKDYAPAEFNSNQLAFDVVYRNDLTPFLAMAKTYGCKVLDGRYMLAAQAALSVLKIVDFFKDELQISLEKEFNFDSIFKVAFNAIGERWK